LNTVCNPASNQPSAQRLRGRASGLQRSRARPGRQPTAGSALLFLGPDQNGVELEVMAVRTTQGLVVIHAMKLRDKYRHYLQGE
jgi:hypothetical protein